MKSLQRILAVILFIAATTGAYAQYCGNSGSTICTAGNTLSLPGFSPPADSVPCAIQGVAYSQIVQVKMPDKVTSGGSTYKLKTIKIDSIQNLPCGLCWATNVSNNTFDSSAQFCLKVTGTTYDNPGQYKLRIIVDATVFIGIGTLTTTQTADASAAGLIFYLRVQTPTGTCTPIDTLNAGLTASTVGTTPSNAVTASGALSFCQGGSVIFTATETGAVYQWYNGSTAITGATSRTYTATTAGSYTVNVVKNCHLVTSTAQTVVVNSPPTATVAPVGPVILCTGSTQLLTATVSGGTKQWYNGTGTIASQTGTTYTATATGTYYVVATQNGCTDTSNKVSIQISGTQPTPTITATSASLCLGHTDTLDAGAGYSSYAWSGSLGSTEKVYPTTSGTYTVTVTNGVCSGSASVVISAGLAPTTPTITPSGTATICQGNSVTLTSSAATTYLWTGGATTQSIPVTGGGPYTVTVTQTGKCGTASSAAVTIVVNPVPTAAVTPAGPVVLCGGGTQLLTATGGGTYQWFKNHVAISGSTATTYTATTSGTYACLVTSNSCSDTSNAVSVQITGSALTPTITPSHPYICSGGTDTLDVGTGYTTYVWSPGTSTTHTNVITGAGTYNVTVTNGSCTGTTSINIVSQGATPTPTITAGSATTFCQGGSVVLTSSSATGNVWSNSATTAAITATTSGSYTVTNNNGCGAATSAPTVVTVNAIPSAHITPTGSALICGGSSQLLTATPAGASYVWLDNGAPISGQTSSTYSASATGAYRALITQSGCSDTSNATTITVSGTPPTPSITATATSLCAGRIDTLNVGAGYTSYTWSGTLGTASTATVTGAGTYTVTVANGVCVGTASITISQGAGATVPTISVTGSLAICGNDSVTLTSSSPTGNVWSNSATTQSITESGAGVFFVTVSGTCGSAVSLPDTVTQIAPPSVYLGPDTGTCVGDTLTLDATTAGATYQWTNGGTSPTYGVTQTAEYYVTVTKSGCSATDSVHVTFDAAPVATFTSVGSLLTASPGAAYQWNKNGGPIPGATSQTLNIDSSGNGRYSVEITNGYCAATSAAVLITISGVVDLSNSMRLSIYPNPTNKEVTISYTLSRGEALEVDMTDMTGRVIKNLYSGTQADGSYSLVTDMAALTGGIYFVNFRTAEGTVVRKVIKE